MKVINKLTPEQIAELDTHFVKDGLIIPVPYDYAAALPEEVLQAYCHLRGMYLVVTHELVEDIKELIEDRSAIEIGSGNGTLGRALGIKMTDNKMQRDIPEIVMLYKLMGQPTIKYPPDVIKMDAVQAVKKHKPDFAIGSWITHKFVEQYNRHGGNMYGVDEGELLNHVGLYLMIGNHSVHSNKLLFLDRKIDCLFLKSKHLISRASNRDADCIYLFKGKKKSV